MKVIPYLPTQEHLQFLFAKFQENKAAFSDEVPSDPIPFVSWLAAEDTTMFAATTDEGDVCGVFIFTGINLHDGACYAHIFFWDRDSIPFPERVLAGQVAAAGVFKAGIRRITGLTPTTHAHARAYAERVGFKVEGRLRKAVQVGGLATDAWISGLLPEDLVEAAASNVT